MGVGSVEKKSEQDTSQQESHGGDSYLGGPLIRTACLSRLAPHASLDSHSFVSQG